MPPPTAAHREGVDSRGSPFSRSYGGILPSSLTRVLPIALVFSTCPPESVWGTGTVPARERFFSAAWDQSLRLKRLGITSRSCAGRICLPDLLHAYPGTTNARVDLPSCVTPLLPAGTGVGLDRSQPPIRLPLGVARARWYWNINQLCIDYASRPRLSSRLTLGG